MNGIEYGRRSRSGYGKIVLFGLLVGGLVWVFVFLVPGSPSPYTESATTTIDAPVADIPATEAELLAPNTSAIQTATPDLPAAPSFNLPDLLDPTINYQLSEFAGRPVIINLWASWCAPCLAEMPALQATYEEHLEEGLIVLGINQTSIDSIDAAQKMIATLEITFPNLRDIDGMTEKLFRVQGLPMSFFVTPNGEIAHQQIGQMSDAQIEEFTHRLIARQPLVP